MPPTNSWKKNKSFSGKPLEVPIDRLTTYLGSRLDGVLGPMRTRSTWCANRMTN